MDSKERFIRIIALVSCISIIILRIIFPDIHFDEISLWLLLVAILLVTVPDIAGILDRLKKLKKGDLEIEFEQRIDILKKNIEQAEEDLEEEVADKLNFMGIPTAIKDKLLPTLGDPRGALVTLAVEIEARLRELSSIYQKRIKGRYISTPRMIEEFVKQGIISSKIKPIFNDFWAIRNEAVHSKGFRLEASSFYEIADLGIRILRLLYVTPQYGYNLLGKSNVTCPICGENVEVEYKSISNLSESASAECQKCGWSEAISNRI